MPIVCIFDGGNKTSVEYMSNTKPIPCNKPDIAVATAMAGEMLGHKIIYMDAWSGASEHISIKMVSEVKKNINIPLFVGGGIRTTDQALKICEAGADIIVVGTAIEDDISILPKLSECVHSISI